VLATCRRQWGRRLGALAAVLALAACANPERGQFLLPLDAIEPGAGPIELGEGFEDAPGAIMSAVIAGELLVGGQAASRMARAPSVTPAAGPAAGPEAARDADEPVVVTGDESGLAAQRQTAFERMTTEQRQARLRQVDQDLLLERWMRTRVAPIQLSRADIRRAQELLAQLGFDPGPVDGLIGPRTRAAVESFEQAKGLPASGEVTPALIDRLALEI
jgi:hypothetical protein